MPSGSIKDESNGIVKIQLLGVICRMKQVHRTILIRVAFFDQYADVQGRVRSEVRRSSLKQY